MELVVDLHVHSHYSRATSKDCTLEGLYRWGKLKGINIIGTGDFTHPWWFGELQQRLEPAGGGLWRLKPEIAAAIDQELPSSVRQNALVFVPTVEIATIYNRHGKNRRLHQLLVASTLEAAGRISERLSKIGNLRADGRPILGLDSAKLLELTKETDPRALYIPAHIWTPWFGLFGSKSGFDSLEEAFGELAGGITAIETGLSSDPFMNWRVLPQSIAITSNSDAHSPQKLGREATVLVAEPTYDNLAGALRTNDTRLSGTIEFFPQEGKYHYDGHRSCQVRLTPAETKAQAGICPVCHKPVTVGVDYQVGELALHSEDHRPSTHKHVEYIIPLIEVLAELAGARTTAGRKVWDEYHRLIGQLGSEFDILRKLRIEQIETDGNSRLATAVSRMRSGAISVEPGYDGQYGTIKVLQTNESGEDRTRQAQLFESA